MNERFNFSKMCRLFAKAYHQDEAVLNNGATWTYGELYNFIKKEADRLQETFSNSTERKSVLLYLPSDLRFITYFFATTTAGHVPFICSLDLKNELVGILQNVSAIITTPEGLIHLKRFADVDKHLVIMASEAQKVEEQQLVDPVVDPFKNFVQAHSSGSTGEPKVINGVLIKFYEQIQEYKKLGPYQKGDVVLSLAPFGHMYGTLLGFLVPFYLGLKVKTIPGGVSFVDVLKPEITEKAHVVVSTPLVYQFLAEMLAASSLDSTKAFADTRVLVSGCLKLDKKVIQTIREKLKVQMFEFYGTTEGLVSSYRNLEVEEQWQFLSGCEWRLNNENALEIHIYLHEGKEKVWYDTGDILEVDTLSTPTRFSLHGRCKEFVKISGVKVFTFEIQNALKECEEVRDVVVLPHPTKEEAIALVLLKSDQATGLPKVKAFCRNNLGASRIPSKFYVMDQLPRDRVGKLNMRELRETVRLLIEKEES